MKKVTEELDKKTMAIEEVLLDNIDELVDNSTRSPNWALIQRGIEASRHRGSDAATQP